MHCPAGAEIVRPSNRPFLAGICKGLASPAGGFGWFVGCHEQTTSRYAFIVYIIVKEVNSSFVGVLPCLIDTGSQVTIIPRKLIKLQGSFEKSRATGSAEILGVGGSPLFGYRFPALLAIYSEEDSPRPLSFGTQMLVVVDSWFGDYGVLGLDVLRKVLLVSDANHICFWPSEVSPQ